MRLFTRVAAVVTILTASLFAQNYTSLNGIAKDATGAVVPNVAIEITNKATSAKRTDKTDGQGRYNLGQVTPGTYKLEAKANGFKSEIIDSLILEVNLPSTVNLTLQVGNVSDSVLVSAEAIQLNTTDASIGNTIGERPITELPFNARNPVGLLALQPGVTFIANEKDDPRSGAVNGGKSDQGNITLDGVDVNDQQSRTAFTSVLRVALDSIQEFRVTTANSGADGGRSSGAQVSLVTKSGTNQLHGSAYEYNRNTITEANDFFSNSAGVGRTVLNRNIWGFTGSSPIKKDKLFIFGNWEERRDASALTATRIVPNADFRNGIFTYIWSLPAAS